MNSQAVWMQGDGFKSSPLTVHSSLGLVKPSVSTPPSPNEVTEFSVRSLSADLYPGNAGCGFNPLQSTRSVAGCRLCSFGVPATTLVVSCPP